MNLTKLVSLFLGIYRIYHNLSKFSSKLKWINVYTCNGNLKTYSTARPNSRRSSAHHSDPRACTSAAHAAARARDSGPAWEDPRVASAFANESRLFLLSAKLTRALFKGVTGFASRTLLLFEFMLYKVPGRTNRGHGLASQTTMSPDLFGTPSTPMSLYVPCATDWGNKRQEWCIT